MFPLECIGAVGQITGLQHVGFPCDDVETTVSFYKQFGFRVKGSFMVGEQHAVFLELGNLVLELYDHDVVAGRSGAINHISLNVRENLDEVYNYVIDLGCTIVSNGIESLPFWDNGIRFFIIEGPEHERIEFCQIL